MTKIYKNEKGVTLISLMIMTIVIIILASVATTTGINTARNAHYQNSVAQLQAIQLEVDSWYKEYKNGNTAVLSYGEEISTMSDADLRTLINNTFNAKSVSSQDRKDYRYFGIDYLSKNFNIEGSVNDYIINVKTRDVLLVSPIESKGILRYSLADVDSSKYSVEASEEEPNVNNNSNNIESRVAEPVVANNAMLPIVWSQSYMSWVKADVTWNSTTNNWQTNNSDLKWYDYSKESKKWANIAFVKEDGKYSKEYYTQSVAGTIVSMEDIIAMYVWIPRFEFNGVDLRFITSQDTVRDGYSVSTAFEYTNTSGNKVILNGFWYGKFEASNYDANLIAIKPNTNSLKNLNITQVNSRIQNVIAYNQNNYNLTTDSYELGYSTNEMWEAVNALSKSEYGNNNILMNSYYEGDGTATECTYNTKTGIAGTGHHDIEKMVQTSKTENTGKITINNTYEFYEYWTKDGVGASTTANIYGIYDMAGGANEFTVDSNGKYYVRGGNFYNILASINLKESVSSNAETKPDYSFRLAFINK